MFNKLTRSQKEDKLIKLKRLLTEIEMDNNKDNPHPESREYIAKWRVFNALSAVQQQKIWDEWKQYHQEVLLSPIYVLHREQRDALRIGNTARVKDLAEQAKTMLENRDLSTVKKPTSLDPWEFQRGWVKAYKDCEQMIKDLQHELNMSGSEEAQEVWRDR